MTAKRTSGWQDSNMLEACEVRTRKSSADKLGFEERWWSVGMRPRHPTVETLALMRHQLGRLPAPSMPRWDIAE